MNLHKTLPPQCARHSWLQHPCTGNGKMPYGYAVTSFSQHQQLGSSLFPSTPLGGSVAQGISKSSSRLQLQSSLAASSQKKKDPVLNCLSPPKPSPPSNMTSQPTQPQVSEQGACHLHSALTSEKRKKSPPEVTLQPALKSSRGNPPKESGYRRHWSPLNQDLLCCNIIDVN